MYVSLLNDQNAQLEKLSRVNLLYFARKYLKSLIYF